MFIPDVGAANVQINLVFNIAIIAVYLLLWLAMKCTSSSASSGSNSTQKIFKSLVVIVFIYAFGWLAQSVGRIFVLPNVKLSALNGFIFSTALTDLSNFDLASNGPVLYLFRFVE
jgi:hypothetical protein